MPIEDAAEISASDGRWRKVQWNNRTGEILLQQKGSPLGRGPMVRIGIYCKSRAEASVIAQEWLEAHPGK